MKRQEQAGQPVIFQYDTIPPLLRRQIQLIWHNTIGTYGYEYDYRRLQRESKPRSGNATWKSIHHLMLNARIDYPIRLSDSDQSTRPDVDCTTYLLNADIEGVLDIIDIAFNQIESRSFRGSSETIADLNARFLEHAVGYQFTGGRLIRIDSLYLHQETVEPAIKLLHEAGFAGPSDEFMDAHEHYRHGRHEEAIIDALKAFESTMKAICDARGWLWNERAPAKELIHTILTNNLVPAYMQTHLSGLRQTLESGLPTVRNKESGHGQGPEAVTVRDYTAAYALHLAASNIVLLVEAHRALPTEES